MASIAQQMSSPTSPYSLSNEDMEQLTDELDEGTVGELTTTGRTYEELVASNQRRSVMSSDTEDSEEHKAGRQSVGFMLGRNSLSNWSTVGGGGKEDSFEDDVPTSILSEEQINTGRKSNLSRHSLSRQSLETPGMSLGHVNVSRRGSNLRSGSIRQASKPSANGGGKESMQPFHIKGRRSQSLNVSHISSSSDETNNKGDSWSPIRSSLDNSFAKNASATVSATAHLQMARDPTRESIGHKANGSLSPIEHRQSKSPAGKSPKRNMFKSPTKSPSRSPLGDISPNRKSPVRSPNERPSLPAKKSGGLSPNGTYSLKEAEGKRLSLPSMSTSNMSVSSGTTETTDSSATLLTEMAQGSQQSVKKVMPKEKAGKKVPGLKTTIPSLSSSRKQNADSGKRVPALRAAETMLSPEKNSLTQARSPAPTPNSQRRVVKRFRASIPMANYHLPEDEEMEDSLERREQKRVDEAAAKLRRGCQDSSLQRADVRKQSTPPETQPKKVTGAETQASEYLNSFEFPETIPAPSAKTLCLFHDQAVANGSISHQYQLNRAATNLLSLHEVILPSVACETNSALKQEQAIAQRNAKDGLPDSQGTAVVEAIEVCRRAVSKCTIAAMKAGGESFRTRERERETDRVKRHVAAEAQRKADEAEARRNRKEARAKARAERYKAQKGERQRNHPRNKELWQEVTRLMVDIQKLEKEERQWNDALAEVKRMEVNRQPPRKVDLAPPQPTSSSGELLSSIDGAGVGLATSTLVQDVTLAAERVNWTLQRVSAAMVESDRLRAEAFDKYEYDGHKFYGYDAGGDAKGLFMTLSAESPGGNW